MPLSEPFGSVPSSMNRISEPSGGRQAATVARPGRPTWRIPLPSVAAIRMSVNAPGLACGDHDLLVVGRERVVLDGGEGLGRDLDQTGSVGIHNVQETRAQTDVSLEGKPRAVP